MKDPRTRQVAIRYPCGMVYPGRVLVFENSKVHAFRRANPPPPPPRNQDRPGFVKTRLVPSRGMSGSCGVYRMQVPSGFRFIVGCVLMQDAVS